MGFFVLPTNALSKRAYENQEEDAQYKETQYKDHLAGIVEGLLFQQSMPLDDVLEFSVDMRCLWGRGSDSGRWKCGRWPGSAGIAVCTLFVWERIIGGVRWDIGQASPVDHDKDSFWDHAARKRDGR
jgi:hypothetical protein